MYPPAPFRGLLLVFRVNAGDGEATLIAATSIVPHRDLLRGVEAFGTGAKLLVWDEDISLLPLNGQLDGSVGCVEPCSRSRHGSFFHGWKRRDVVYDRHNVCMVICLDTKAQRQAELNF